MDSKKIMTYAFAISIPCLILALVLIFAAHLSFAYILFYELLCVQLCLLVVGTAWHTVKADWNVSLVASKIWQIAASAFIVWMIVTDKWSSMTTAIGFLMLSTVNALGFRFVCTDNAKFVSDKRADKVERLASTMMYKVDQDGKEIVSEPLCIVDGMAVTPAEARRKGCTAIADAAYKYIESIV